jgi:hypothetical protein
MSARPKTPAFRTLTTFARGYLHQDFVEEYGDAKGAAAAFSRDAGPRSAARLRDDIERLLAFTEAWPLADLRAFVTGTLGAEWHVGARRELAGLVRALGAEARRERR